MSEAVAVIGGGISGVQAALDLANAGIEVHLIERSPSLGGHMAQLDKTFPTNDCAACILSPKLVEVYRHPLVKVWTLTEVTGLEGDSPDFRLKVRVSSRYVDEDKCVGCGECSLKCPVKLENEFDMGMGLRKAIYIPFPQAVPLKYSIDASECLMLTEGRCGICQKVCPADAIEFDMKEREEALGVGAVIVATGFDQFDPDAILPYNYSGDPDILTALQFERILSPSGPTGGKLVCRDGRPPRRIVFVQCVGSRDRSHCEHCSRFCCMASLKQAVVAMEHEPLIEEVTICYIDLRTYGKDYDRYGKRARSEGIRLLKGRVAEIALDPKVVLVEDVESGTLDELGADMVVLAVAAIPSTGTEQLADALGIELGSDGFLDVRTSGEGAVRKCSGPVRSSPSSSTR